MLHLKSYLRKLTFVCNRNRRWLLVSVSGLLGESYVFDPDLIPTWTRCSLYYVHPLLPSLLPPAGTAPSKRDTDRLSYSAFASPLHTLAWLGWIWSLVIILWKLKKHKRKTMTESESKMSLYDSSESENWTHTKSKEDTHFESPVIVGA